MLSFGVTSLHTNIPIIDSRNIIIIYVNNDDQFTRKRAIPQDRFHLVNLVLITTWYTFNSQFYQQTDGGAMGCSTSPTTTKIHMQAHEHTAISRALYRKRANLEKNFHHINILHQNIKFTIEEESNGELAFLGTLLE